MRYQIARVTLGAFFCVASAMSQEPATSTETLLQLGSAQSGSSGGSSHSEETSYFENTLTPKFGTRPSSTGLHGTYEVQGDTQDYTMTSLFLQNHGEFMDRFERYDPSLEIRGRLMPHQNVVGDPGSFGMVGYDFDIEVPMLVSTEAYLLFGVYQYGRHYDSSSTFGIAGNAEGWGDETLTAAGARIGFGWFLDPNLLLEVETNPGVYSDLEEGLTHKDYDFPSSALFTFRPVENFFFKFGARYSQMYQDAPWVPYLGFSWEIVQGLRIDLLAPEYVELSWWPSASTSFALGTEVRGAQYRVHKNTSSGKQAADIQIQEVVSYFGLTHRFSDAVSLQTRAGVVIAGHYDLSNGADNFQRFDGSLSQGFYADVTFGIDW